MSTVSEIVTQAYREGNFIAIGETPSTEEMTEAVPRLRNLIDALFGFEIGEAYYDWFVPSEQHSHTPLRVPYSAHGADLSVSASDSWKITPSNVRLLVKTTAALSVYLPPFPNDGARLHLLNMGSSGALNFTLDGNGHLVENAVSLTDTLTNLHDRKWFYRADLGNWVQLISIVDENSTILLPEEFNDLLICGLAMRLSARFQTPVDQVTATRYQDMLQRLKKRYAQTVSMPASQNELRSSAIQPSFWGL